MYNIKKPTFIFTDMNSSIIQLDNSDQMLIYQQNLQQMKGQIISYSKQKLQLTQFRDPKKQQLRNGYETIEKGKKGLIELPAKFVIRPLLIKYFDRILQLYLQQKSPNQIQTILKQPTLVEIQCILKQKIHTFLNIIFESSHCFTEQQVQKIRPQVNQKIQRISLEMLDPYRNNFIDSIRYQNFLKLMKYHKEGRRSEKISKKCNTFFRLFFIKMKFQGISHTEGNVIELNESKNRNRDSFQDQNDSSEEYDCQGVKSKKNNKSTKKDQLYGSKSSTKKYFYGRQTVVNQKMMDEAKQSLLKQIRDKLVRPQSQKQNPNKLSNQNKTDKNFFQKKSQVSTDKSQVQIIEEEQDDFQWTFDKQNTFLFILFDSHFKKSKISKIIKSINQNFSKKYQKVRKQPLDLDQITSKIQSMFSISCQKFIRRIKYLTIKQGLQNNPHLNANQNKKQNPTIKSSRKKKVYSIMDIQKSIEKQNDQKNLSKQDQFYFSKLKQHLKALQVKEVYLSSSVGSPCQQQWNFMLDFIREFYFSVLEEFKFDHLLEYAKRVIQMHTTDKKIDNTSITVQGQGNNQQNSQQEKEKQADCEKDLLERLPKSSFCFTLSRMRKSKAQQPLQKTNNIQENQKAKNLSKNKQLEFVSIDDILRRSNNQNIPLKNSEIQDRNLTNNQHKDKQSNIQIKIQYNQKPKNIQSHSKEKFNIIQQKIVTSSITHKYHSTESKNKQFKRISPQFVQDQTVKKQNDMKNNRTAKRSGQPIKKIKQNQTIPQYQEIPVKIYDLQDTQEKVQFESDDQFQEILQLSSSVEERFLQESESPKNLQLVHDQQEKQKQTETGKQIQEQSCSQPQSTEDTKKTITVKPRGPRYTYQDQDIIQNEEIQDLIRSIQAQQLQNQKDEQQQYLHPDLSIIHQEDEEDGSQNIANSKEIDKLKNSLALQDQYSMYQIDFSTQQNQQNHQKTEKSHSNYKYNDDFSKTNKFYSRKIEEKQKQSKYSNSTLSLQIIRKQLQKIKSMGNQVTQPQQRQQYSSEKIMNRSDRR